MSESKPCSGKTQGQLPTVHDVMARVQRLSETPRSDGGYPLATYVEAHFLGDVTAIAAAAIRSEGLLKR
jgi:hypothetical protein